MSCEFGKIGILTTVSCVVMPGKSLQHLVIAQHDFRGRGQVTGQGDHRDRVNVEDRVRLREELVHQGM